MDDLLTSSALSLRAKNRSERTLTTYSLAPCQPACVDIAHSMVVGDSVWDLLAAHRARAMG